MKHIKFAIMNEYGEIDVVYGDEESLHCVLLTEYIKSKGLIKDNVTLDFNDPNNLSLFLREQGKVVFLNTTNYRKITKYGKSGIVIIPDDFLEKQKENLIKLNEYISDFVEMQIWYDFSTRTQCRTYMPQIKHKCQLY